MAEDLADRVFSEYVIKKEIVDEETLASNSSTVTHSTSEFTSDASVNKKKQLANGHCVQHCENDTPRQTNNNNLKDSACKNTRSHSVPFSKNGKKMPNGNEERMVPAKWSKFKPVLNRIRNSDSLRAQKKTREQSPCHISSRRRRKLLPWYSYTVMLLIYIAYLFLGAVVFSFLESKAEEAKCKEAKRQVSVQKSDFSKKYFYIFGLNFKFCKGIQMYKANSDPAQLALDASYVKYFDKWLSSNCSKPAETKIWNEIQGKNETFMKRYIEIWKSISKTVLADSFNDEILVVSGATIKSVLQLPCVKAISLVKLRL